MSFRFVFEDSFQGILKKLNQAAIRKFYDDFYGANVINGIRDAVASFVLLYIKRSRTWQSLSNGGPEGLDAHFGIPKEELSSRLEGLLNIWAKEIVVKPQNIKYLPRTFIFSYKFYAIKADWANVLGSRLGVTINDSARSRLGLTPTEIPWLEWLLVNGNDATVEGYHIEFKNYPKSRSGKAYMKPKLSWRIPNEFGVANTNDNFITRALNEIVEDSSFRGELSNIIINALKGTDTGSGIFENYDLGDFNLDDI